MKYERILKSLLFYIIGILLLLLSAYLSDHVSYSANFTSEFTIALPIAFSIASIVASPFFILDRNYPYFFRTGISSLLTGITLFVFGIISHSFAKPIVWASSLGVGLLFIVLAFVNLIIQGGLSAYRKSKYKNQEADLEITTPYESRYKNPKARKYFLWGTGALFLVSGLAGISTSLLSGKVYSFGGIISILLIIGGAYFIYDAYREVRRDNA